VKKFDAAPERIMAHPNVAKRLECGVFRRYLGCLTETKAAEYAALQRLRPVRIPYGAAKTIRNPTVSNACDGS
jgi:hypothetical protein